LAEDAARYRSEPETGEGSEQLANAPKHAERNATKRRTKYHHFELASAVSRSENRAGVGNHHHWHNCAGLGVGHPGVCGHRGSVARIFSPHLLHLH